jgi:nitrite reductase/ring-hydroxylating ferredoxin subunit/uncharacterized membrane protein
MPESKAVALIESQDWLEPVADSVQKAVGECYESMGEPGRELKNFLHGTWLGHPLHAALTDVPVGAWTAAVVMDAIGDISGDDRVGRAADTAVAIGLVGAVAAAAAGVTDWKETDGRARRMGLTHGLMNVAATGLFAGSLVARRNGSRGAGRGLSTLGFLVAMGSAWLGGKLVYSEQVGVDHTIGQRIPEEFTPVLAESDLAEGQMLRIDTGTARILLARRDGRIFAISEVCSHFGGPLAEGEFIGCTVKCPWHGSRFSLEDGSVIDGPATHPAPCLNVRVANGQIEVKMGARG